MDYDENEFHAKNLHLAGEGNNKIPVIPPYAIPKFEFDDSLQGSLRFDTLDSENFLGIGSNEDNQWIEEYSRGGSGIHFGADTSKSCSITRQSNVWSEATSSESVEMLLKSVVQEDILRLQSDNKVSDSCDELGCMIKQMESNSKRKNSSSSFVCNAAQSPLSAHILPEKDVGLNDSEHGHDTGIVSAGELTDLGGLSSMLPAIPVEQNMNAGYEVTNECVDDTEVNEQPHHSEPDIKGSVAEMVVESVEVVEKLNEKSNDVDETGGVGLENELINEASRRYVLDAKPDVEVSVPETSMSGDTNTLQKKVDSATGKVVVTDESFLGANEKVTEFYSPDEKSDVADPSGFSNSVDVNPAYAYSPSPSSIMIEVADKNNNVERKGIDENDERSLSKNSKGQVSSMNICPESVPDSTDSTVGLPEKTKSDSVAVVIMPTGVENCIAGEKTDVPGDIENSECPAMVATKSSSDVSNMPLNRVEDILVSASMSLSDSLKQSSVPSKPGNAKAKLKDEREPLSPKGNELSIDVEKEKKNVRVSESHSSEIGPSLNTGGLPEIEESTFDDSSQIQTTDTRDEKEICGNSVEMIPSVEREESEIVSKKGKANSRMHSIPLSNGNDVEQVEPPSVVKTFSFHNESGEKNHVEEQVSSSPLLSSSKVVEQHSPSSELRHVEDHSQVSARRNAKSLGNSESKPKRSYNKSAKKESAKKPTSAKVSSSARVASVDKAQNVASNMPENALQLPQPASVGAFQQPFTDLQQVQLRAQIFVYGSLIQGIAPEESYMISAFGGPDGSKNLWENLWRTCYQRSKLLLSTPETPLNSRAGSRPSDQLTKDLKLSSTSQSNIKSAPFLTPILPFSSPLWTPDPLQSGGLPKIPAEFHRAWSPLPSQNTHSRNINTQTPSWLTQPPLGGPWVASPSTSVLDASSRLLASKLGYESPQLHHGSDPSPQVPSASKQITPIPASLMEFSSTIVAEASAPKDVNNFAPAPLPSAEPKSRKRRKNVSESTARKANAILPGYNAEKPVILPKANHVEELKTLLPEDALEKVKESKACAEEAASIAAAALNHSQELHNRIENYKTSGSFPDNNVIIASAIGAITAAASVAKAAAAAASLASNAALQAKLMAEEAMGKTSLKAASLFNDAMTKASPASILKGDNSSISILGAARETARRRVEAASAASKRAENMDAIVKAAELAAEAVSQAGKIVAMGDHVPISELISSSMKSTGSEKKSVDCNEMPIEDNVRLIDVIASKGNFSKEKGRKLSEFLGVSQTEFENRDNYSIKEGSVVEVYKEGGGLKGAWFCGTVVGLNDGKALVCYADLMLGEEKLKEWVDLRKSDGGHKAPKIRLSRPAPTFPIGTRKRRRSAYGDKKWSIGDRVDAWSRDCWSEGVVSDKKSQGDDFIYTVRFPVNGETAEVKSWDLRPTLTWKDGEWSERTALPYKGDSPAEKKGRFDLEKSVQPEPTLSQLTASDRIFNMGKGSTGPLRMTRTGSQKEGANVVFGVPKPGKKRKFIEVSKHYVASQTSKPPPPTRGSKNVSKPSLLPKPKPPKAPAAFGRSAGDSTSKRHVDGEFVFSSQPKESSSRSKGLGSNNKVEETAGSSDANEPRRSNRRIQPTSRLLEGLQTSLMVSKLPSVAYDKSGKSKSNTKR